MLAEMAAGFSTIRPRPDLLLIAFLIVHPDPRRRRDGGLRRRVAVDILGTGPEGVGYIDSVFGIGAIVGGVFAIARIARNRLAIDLATGHRALGAPAAPGGRLARPPVTVFAAASSWASATRSSTSTRDHRPADHP